MSQGTLIVVVGGAFLVLLTGACYWMEARRGRDTRIFRPFGAAVLAFIFGECGRVESRWFLVPAGILIAVALVEFVRMRKDGYRRS